MLRRGNVVCLDIEGVGHPATTHPSRVEVVCLGLFDGVEALMLTEELFTEPFPELWTVLSQMHLLMHNGLYDAAVMGWTLRRENKPLPIVEDTMLLHYALNPGRGVRHALKIVGPAYLGIEDWGLDFGKAYNEDGAETYLDARSYALEDLWRYCALDVQNDWDLFQELSDWARRTQPEQWKAYRTVLIPAASDLLVYMRSTGISTDTRYAREELVDVLEQKVASHESRLVSLADEALPGQEWPRRKARGSIFRYPIWYNAFNPASPKQVKAVMEKVVQELPPRSQARFGKVESTDKKSLERLNEFFLGRNEFVKELLGFRAQSKVLGTYARPIADRSMSDHPYGNDRVFPVYKLHGTQSGRLSSENPNIQNQPKTKEVRRAYIPRSQRRKLLQVDYGQAELRVMAALSMDPWLLYMFNESDEDIFDQMLPMMFPSVDFTKVSPEQRSKYRRQLKTVIYGLAFSRGAEAIATELKVSVRYAQGIIDTFLGRAAGMNKWRHWVMECIRTGTPLVTRFGRYFQSPPVFVSDAYVKGIGKVTKNLKAIERSALSFLPQSSASDCCLLSAVDVAKEIRREDKDWDVVALVHDAITVDVPEDEVEEALHMVSGHMIRVAKQWFPEVRFTVDGKWGDSWDQTG